MKRLVLCAFLVSSLSASAATTPEVYSRYELPSVSDFNTTTGQVERLLPTTSQPGSANSLYLSPNRKLLFEIGHLTGSTASIFAFDPESGALVQSYTTQNPVVPPFLSDVPFAVSPDGRRIFVATCNPSPDDPGCFMEVFQVNDGAFLAAISTPQIAGIAISPDGSSGYFSELYYPSICGICLGNGFDPSSGAVQQFDPTTLKLGGNYDVPNLPGKMAISPDSSTLYVGSSYGYTGIGEPNDVLSVALPAFTITTVMPVKGSVNLALSSNGAVLVAGASQYFTNDSDWLTVLSPADLSILGTVPVPSLSQNGFVIDSTGDNVYIGNGTNSQVYQVGTSSLTITSTFSVADPVDLALTPSGRQLIALQLGATNLSAFSEGSITPTRVGACGAGWIAFAPDGKAFYDTGNGSAIEMRAVGSGTLLATFPMNGATVAQIAVSPNNKYVYAVGFVTAGNPYLNVWKLNAATGAVVQDVQLTDIPLLDANFAIALSPDGSTLVVNPPDEPIAILDAHTLKTIGGVHAASGAVMSIDPTGQFLWTQSTQPGGSQVTVVDLKTSQVVATIPVAGDAFAFAPDQPVAYIANGSAGIAVVNTASYTVTSTIAVETGVGQALAVTSDGNYLYAVGYLNGNGAYETGALIDLQTMATTPFSGIGTVLVH